MRNHGPPSTIKGKILNLAEKIPGLSGYLREEDVRDKDKALRDALSGEIEKAIQRIVRVQEGIAEAGRLQEIGVLEKTVKRLERLRDSMRHASYGYKGGLGDTSGRRRGPDDLYTFDLSIVEAVHELTELVSGPLALSRQGTLSKVFLEELNRTVERLERCWEERYR